MEGRALAAMVPWTLVAFHTGSIAADIAFGLLLLIWADDDWRRRIKRWAAGVPGRTRMRVRKLCPRPRGECGLDETEGS